MTWETALFLPVLLASFGYAAFQLKAKVAYLKAATGKTRPRFDRIPERAQEVLYDVFLHRTLLKDPVAGVIHFTIFWGFLLITIGTLEQFATTLYAPANFEFLGETFYPVLVAVMDFFTVAVGVAVLVALFRRLILKLPRLGGSPEKFNDALIILIFTGSLMASILLMNGFHILGLQPWYAQHLFFSNILAQVLSGLGLGAEAHVVLGTGFKWLHMLIVLGFAMYIPRSKHLHVITAIPNVFMKTLGRTKAFLAIPFEDEMLQQYGVAKTQQLSWKDTLDLFTCTECGRCQDLCPAWNTEKPLSPKKIIIDLRNALVNKPPKSNDAHVVDDKVTEDVIWACTTCRACEIACPVNIEHTDKIVDIRRNLVMMESRFPPEVQTVFKNMETQATPWAFSAADRAAWAQGLSVPTVVENPNPDVLLWVGCAGSYDDRNKKVLRAFVSLLKKAQVNFAMLGNEEKCTGDPARRIGNEYLFNTLAKQNVETLGKYKFKRIVTSCPHCFNTLKNEYGDFGGHYQVVHHSQFLGELILQGKLKNSVPLGKSVAFHDSCYLGRWNDVYSAPRDVIKASAPTQFTELEEHHDKSLCCGAGGGRMFMEEKIGGRINLKRTDQAIRSGAEVVASACPFCMTMLTDGMKAKEMLGKIRVADVAELLDESN